MKAEQREDLTFGQKACGYNNTPTLDQVKMMDAIRGKFSELIDLLNAKRGKSTPAQGRYYSKAISYAEDAQMNAVKAATWSYED